MKLLTNFTLNFDKLSSYPAKAISSFDLNDYSVTIYFNTINWNFYFDFRLKNFYTNQELNYRLHGWQGLGFVIDGKTLFVNNEKDIRQLFSILASTYNNISVAGYTLNIYCTNTINAKVSSKVKFVRVNLCSAGNVAMNSACDFGVAYKTLITMIEVCYDTVLKNLQYYYIETPAKIYRLEFSDTDKIKGLLSKYDFILRNKITNGDIVKSMI